MNPKVAFVGAGRWALSLAIGLARKGTCTALWEFDPARFEALSRTRRHPDLPESALIPDQVTVSANIGAVLADADIVVFATPSGALAEAARSCARLVPTSVAAVVTAAKGIDPENLERMSVVLSRALAGRPVVVLVGPGIPYDYALGDPTSLVAASSDESAARLVRDCFSGGNLRVYSAGDVVGVELGAALKNVIAIAAGIGDGLGLSLNAKSALLTRGLAEMSRLGLAMNASPLTFAGLSGMGDLIVTAFSPHSRNHRLGLLIGQGKTLAEALQTMNGVAEGIAAAQSARRLASHHGIEMPITEEVWGILNRGENPRTSLKRLLGRKPRQEDL